MPRFVSRGNVDLMRKLVDLQNFAIYWDTNAELIGDQTGFALEVRFTSSICLVNESQSVDIDVAFDTVFTLSFGEKRRLVIIGSLSCFERTSQKVFCQLIYVFFALEIVENNFSNA